jgi:hypothetical protein
MWANDPEMAKKWEKEEKMKKETKVRSLIRKMVREIMAEDFAGAHPKENRKKFDKMRRKQSEVLGYTLTGKDDIKAEIDDATIKETKKRDYKAEYKKYGSSTKAKKYRAELNKYNRDKGTYGNGDKKDASHKGGKIVGFEEQSKNRGRAEKSRLKKEGKLTEDKFIAFYKKDRVTVNAKSLWDAKKQIIAKLKVPKKDVGLVSVLNKTEYDKQKFRFEGKLNEKDWDDRIPESGPIQVARRVVLNKQYEKYKGVMLDTFTASAIIKVYDAVNDSNKKKLSKLKLPKLVDVVWKLLKRAG